MNTISQQDLKKKIDAEETITIVDVRAAHLYSHSHIPGAVNVEAVQDFAALLEKIVPDKDVEIIMYNEFQEDKTDEDVVAEAEAAGYKNISVLADGMMGWMGLGYPVKFGQES